MRLPRGTERDPYLSGFTNCSQTFLNATGRQIKKRQALKPKRGFLVRYIGAKVADSATAGIALAARSGRSSMAEKTDDAIRKKEKRKKRAKKAAI